MSDMLADVSASGLNACFTVLSVMAITIGFVCLRMEFFRGLNKLNHLRVTENLDEKREANRTASYSRNSSPFTERKSSLPKQLSDHIDRVLFLLSNHIKLIFLEGNFFLCMTIYYHTV
jgi:hypothetical protein